MALWAASGSRPRALVHAGLGGTYPSTGTSPSQTKIRTLNDATLNDGLPSPPTALVTQTFAAFEPALGALPLTLLGGDASSEALTPTAPDLKGTADPV